MNPASPPPVVNDVRLAVTGDREAYGRLYDQYAPAVRAVTAAVSCDLSAVEDLTQETFLRGFVKLSSLRNPAAFGPWIKGIARQVCRERRRQLKRDRHRYTAVPLDVADTSVGASPLELVEETQRVLTAVGRLPARERMVLHAYFFHEQNAAQAADSVGLSRSGFYKVFHRALKKLRVDLESSSMKTSAKESTT